MTGSVIRRSKGLGTHHVQICRNRATLKGRLTAHTISLLYRYSDSMDCPFNRYRVSGPDIQRVAGDKTALPTPSGRGTPCSDDTIPVVFLSTEIVLRGVATADQADACGNFAILVAEESTLETQEAHDGLIELIRCPMQIGIFLPKFGGHH